MNASRSPSPASGRGPGGEVFVGTGRDLSPQPPSPNGGRGSNPNDARTRRSPRPRLRDLLAQVVPGNRVLRPQAGRLGRPRRPAACPFTTKAELVADQAEHPPYGSNLTYPLDRYSRLHQTSGTSTGRPLRWLDTPRVVGVDARLLAGDLPVMGLTARTTCSSSRSRSGRSSGSGRRSRRPARVGCLCLPGGGHEQHGPAAVLLEHQATVVLRDADLRPAPGRAGRAQEGIDLAGQPVRLVIVAGEPGGEHSGDAGPHRVGLGGPRHRPLRHDRGRAGGGRGSGSPGGHACTCRAEYVAEVLDPTAKPGRRRRDSANWC